MPTAGGKGTGYFSHAKSLIFFAHGAEKVACPLSSPPAQNERLRELANDLHLVWQHRGTSPELKKRILRTVIEEIVVHSSDDPPHGLHVHWKGGVHSTLYVKKNGSGQHGRVADEKAVELIEEISKVYSDETIAQVLNRLGYRTGQGNTWRVHHVHNLRYWRGPPNHHHSGGWLSLEETARELRNCSISALQSAGCRLW